jgi:osmotically-inducible protein OsmY
MGIFDFIKSAGKKLGIGGDDDAPEADAVKKELDSFGLGTDKVDVKVDGDKVVLSGVVEDQSIFEKAIVAVGNTLGISKVEASELKVVMPESGLKLG